MPIQHRGQKQQDVRKVNGEVRDGGYGRFLSILGPTILLSALLTRSFDGFPPPKSPERSIVADLSGIRSSARNLDNNKETTKTKIKSSSVLSSSSEPKIAWLMSYPNSGTTYTTHLIMETTNTSTATNYGNECHDLSPSHGINVPVHSNLLYQGPYWKDLHLRKPTNYVLTKTHCGGRCVACGPEKYIETYRSFRIACSSGTGYVPPFVQNNNKNNKDNKDKKIEIDFETIKPIKMNVRYNSTSIVKKAIHLIRDPFDNVVSRFHMEYKNHDSLWKQTFPKTREGFRSWCQRMDDRVQKLDLSSRFLDDELRSLWSRPPLEPKKRQKQQQKQKEEHEEDDENEEEVNKKVSTRFPCHSEFYRWIQWHNLAYATIRQLNDLNNNNNNNNNNDNHDNDNDNVVGVPRLVLYYENYTTSFHDTVHELMDFLEFTLSERSSTMPEFITGKQYRTYYDIHEIHRIKDMIQMLAMADVWTLVKHYF